MSEFDKKKSMSTEGVEGSGPKDCDGDESASSERADWDLWESWGLIDHATLLGTSRSPEEWKRHFVTIMNHELAKNQRGEACIRISTLAAGIIEAVSIKSYEMGRSASLSSWTERRSKWLS